MSLVKHYLLSQDKFTLILSLGIPIYMLILIVLHAKWKKKENMHGVWRVLCLLPLAASLIHFVLYHFHGSLELTKNLYLHIYIVAVLVAVWQFFCRKKVLYHIVTVLFLFAAAYCSVSGTFGLLESYPVVGNFTKYDYVECFEKIMEEMKEHYCLNEWKEIDYEELNNKIMPKVKEAQDNKDAAGFYAALAEYCYYFYDSHVDVWTGSYEISEPAKERLAGNDYGFSMFTIENGDTIAVLTDEDSEAMKKGIHNGTVITAWNDEPIDLAKEKVSCIYPGLCFPVKSNEDEYRAAFLAGKGDEQVRVSFIDDSGEEQTATLSSIGAYAERLDLFIITFKHDLYYDSAKRDFAYENFHTEMLSEDCGYLYVRRESYDDLKDVMAAIKGEYPEVVSLLDEKLEDLKAQGMKTLVIDSRNNVGGYDEIAGAVASLFTDKAFFNYCFGEYKNGQYISEKPNYVQPYGKWKDLDVVVLTNDGCVSAGDGLVYSLSQCPNVTVMGITCSGGVNQNNGGTCFATNSECKIGYPFALTLNENGEPHIDTKADRETRIPLDVKIPVTAEDAQAIFSYRIEPPTIVMDRDFELEYAVKYLEERR